MEKIEKKIREIAKKLLKDKKVSLIIGFEKGTLPLKSRPTFVRNNEDVEKLTWNSFCTNNLAVYIPYYRKYFNNGNTIAVIAKGCDIRSLVLHFQECLVDRSNIYIVGVPCSGMLDRRRIEKELYPDEIEEVTEKEDSIIVKGKSFEKKLNKTDYLSQDCLECAHRNPVIYDEIIDIKIKEPTTSDAKKRLDEFSAKDKDERWEIFTREVSECIRCYACRNACPGCYCEECFVDCTQPQWLGTSVDSISDLQMFQIVRTLHLAGRCVNCGNCSRACPMEIDISLLVRKLSQDAKEMFGYETGVKLEDKPLLSKYSEDDPNEGFFGES
jgi:formate dehydrogenase subunit beta